MLEDLFSPRKIFDKFDKLTEYEINDCLILFNALLCVDKKLFEEKEHLNTKADCMKIISKLFNSLDDSNIIDSFNSVDRTNKEFFWEAFSKYKVYNKISITTFDKLTKCEDFILWQVIKHKDIVNTYSSIINNFLLANPIDAATLLIDEYLIEKIVNNYHYYFPKELNDNDKKKLILNFVDSNPRNFDYLRIISEAQSSEQLPLEPKTQIKAKHLYKETIDKMFKDEKAAKIDSGLKIYLDDIDEDCIVSHEGYIETRVYNKKWLEDNLDPPTILNNFIYFFGYTNKHFLCQFISKYYSAGVFEQIFGLKGTREYKIDSSSRKRIYLSSMQMSMYYNLLSAKNINIENVFKWFFEEYLKDEFNVDGFVFNASESNYPYLQKCKSLCIEIDGVLKQYNIFCEEGFVDRELLEFSSEHVLFENVKSLLPQKYAYGTNKFIKHSYSLFEHKSSTSYTERYKDKYKSLLELIMSEDMTIDDFYEWNKDEINEMISDSILEIDNNGIIKPHKSNVMILRLLSIDRAICLNYFNGFDDAIEKLINDGMLEKFETLLSKPEQQYLNYVLNKAEFSNGLDLRNKYCHSTNSINEERNYYDYIELLKIMVLIIIKINEEFLLKEKLDNKKDESTPN